MSNEKYGEGFLDGSSLSDLKTLAANLKASYEATLDFLRDKMVEEWYTGDRYDGVEDVSLHYYTGMHPSFSFNKSKGILTMRYLIENERGVSNIKGSPIFLDVAKYPLSPYRLTESEFYFKE
jgi:hypothetical protein